MTAKRTMGQSSRPLDRSILAAFTTAHEAGRLDVAEHLLCALECLCGGAGEGTAAEDAYRIVCDCGRNGESDSRYERKDR